MQGERILIIDDDRELVDLVAEFLEDEGYDIALAHDGMKGYQRAISEEFVLILLDVMLPSLNGFEILKRVRQVSNVPIIMMTAKGDDVDKIVGLEIGADDYVAKPFNPRELVARTHAILRRTTQRQVQKASTPPAHLLVVGDVSIDISSRVVLRGTEEIIMTSAEFDVLHILLKMAGKVLTRENLAREAMGRELLPFERAIDMHVSNVRRKLGSHANGMERIKSIRSVGYIYTVLESGK